MTTFNGRYAEIRIEDLLELYLCQLEVTSIPHRYTHREKNEIVRANVDNLRKLLAHAKQNNRFRINSLDDIPF